VITGSWIVKRWKIFWGGLTGVLSARLRKKSRPERAEIHPSIKKREEGLMSRVAIVRKTTVEEMIERAIELAGGMEIPPKATVLIKPNQNSDDSFPATSNPATIAGLVNYVKRFNPKRIVVADASFQGFLPTMKTMKTTGVFQAARDAGADVVALEDDEFVSVMPEGAENWQQPFRVSKLYMEADYVINQPVIKTHKYAIYSMTLKNTIGVIVNADRPLMHSAPDERFRRMIAELNLARLPDFVVLDGQKAMVTGGPFTGEVKEANLMIATRDPVAADVVGLAVLKFLSTTDRIQNNSVWEQPVLKRAVELGLGARSRDEIDLVSDGIPEIDQIEKHLL
jgi:uncharacterized protein (DUF362 family)